MRNVVVTDTPRADIGKVTRLGEYGVATVHEALGRTGYLGPQLRPVYPGSRVGGTAVTALCWPGDNLMIHAAVEQCRRGDLLVVTTASPCSDGSFGELLATALQARGVRGLVTTGGIRDANDLKDMEFPVWSAAVSAQGTVKATPGSVNVPVVVGGQLIRPGDAVLADDDGAMVVPRSDVDEALDAAQARIDKEQAAREAFRAGELGLDRYDLRTKLAELDVAYVTAEEYSLSKGMVTP